MDGSCLCGEVRYEATPPYLFCAHCHCRWCREAHGAAFVTWVGVSEDRFRIVAGDPTLRWYQSTPQSRRGFCGQCGTTLLYTSALSPGEVHVSRASLRAEIVPTVHVFYDQKVDWVELADQLPRFETGHAGLAKYRVVPPR